MNGPITIKSHFRLQHLFTCIPSTMIPATGRGMAGKTSLMRALQSPENKTLGINRNDRTLGIDLATWKPNTEGDFISAKTPVEFTTYDFAGQDSYYSRYLWRY